MRLNHQCNLGELAYFEGDYPTALEHFRTSEQSLGPSVMPADIRFLVNAAIGLCSVELGASSEARRREEAVRAFQEAWHFDPTLPLTFSVRLLERRASLAEAYAALKSTLPQVRLRFPIAWLKLLPLEARLARRLRNQDWRTSLQAGISLAQDLRLVTRVRILEDILRI